MTKKMNILLVSLLLTCFVFGYLTLHHYQTQLGLGGSNLCAISSTVNCDTAALSQYSEVAGIPVAVFGLSFSAIMLLLVGFARLNWIEPTPFLKTSLRLLFAFAALVSIVLGAISLIELKVVCPFCFASYILSFINLYLVWNLFPEVKENFELSNLSQNYGLLFSFAFIPFVAWFISGSVQDNYGLSELRKLIPEKISQWQSMPEKTFDKSVGLHKGNPEARATLVEFADFKCPHCKVASKTLSLYLKGNQNVQLIFKPFPLDGNCNPHVSFKGDGSRCQMAAWTLCSEQVSQKGWAVHDWIFERQDELMQISDLKESFTKMSSELGLDFSTIQTCADSAETYATIKKSSDEGQAAEVSGTPTIYLNNKKLGHGQYTDILKAAISTIK